METPGHAQADKPLPGTREYEWFLFANPPDWIIDPDSGFPRSPQGTDWEDGYKSLVLENERATSQGLPSHAAAIKSIDDSAATSNGMTQRHKIYVLSVKHQTANSRPEEATDALRDVFERLLDREFNSEWNSRATARDLPFSDDPRLIIYRDVAYGSIEPELQTVDAYIVRSDKPTPVLMEFHGGGWRRGRRNMLSLYKGDLIRKVLDAGISVVSVDYRLAPKYRFPAQMEDAARAVQLVRSKAGEWNIDPQRISAIGGSAGGHLLSWVALNDDQVDLNSQDPVARQSSRLTCFVAQWAPLDLTRVDPRALQRSGPRGPDAANAFCSVLSVHPEDYNKSGSQAGIRAASPVFQVTPDDPPAFIMYGGTPRGFDVRSLPSVSDAIHNPHSYLHAVLLVEALDRAGVPHVPHFGPSVGK
ncbi:MAG: alpha/beta hydrolase, partial [Planctomycetaceae bacterium]